MDRKKEFLASFAQAGNPRKLWTELNSLRLNSSRNGTVKLPHNSYNASAINSFFTESVSNVGIYKTFFYLQNSHNNIADEFLLVLLTVLVKMILK